MNAGRARGTAAGDRPRGGPREPRRRDGGRPVGGPRPPDAVQPQPHPPERGDRGSLGGRPRGRWANASAWPPPASLQPEALAGARDEAMAIARAADPVDDWPGLPPPRPVKKVDGYDAATAETTAEARADLAGGHHRRRQGQEGRGRRGRRDRGEFARGREFGRRRGGLQLHQGPGPHGHDVRGRVGVRRGPLDAHRRTSTGRAIGRRAAAKAADSRKPRAIEPGRYDVVLEPAAVAEWLEYLSYIAFSGKNLRGRPQPALRQTGPVRHRRGRDHLGQRPRPADHPDGVRFRGDAQGAADADLARRGQGRGHGPLPRPAAGEAPVDAAAPCPPRTVTSACRCTSS